MNTKDDEKEKDKLVTKLYLWNRQIQVIDDQLQVQIEDPEKMERHGCRKRIWIPKDVDWKDELVESLHLITIWMHVTGNEWQTKLKMLEDVNVERREREYQRKLLKQGEPGIHDHTTDSSDAGDW